jgi:dTDP-4-amino-4,6-dideoxygalactose transaminase
MVFTRDEALYQSARRMADRGKPHFLPEGATNIEATLNFNQTDLAAVVGQVQLRKLPEMVERRRAIVGQLIEGTADLEMIALPQGGRDFESSYWFLPVAFYPERAACDKETFCESLRAEGLPVTDDYRSGMPHRQTWYMERRVFGSSGYPWASPLYKGDPNRGFPCPNAQAMLKSHFTMSLHENWGTREIDDVIAIFHKVAAAYTPA